jgi:hypothetical protein
VISLLYRRRQEIIQSTANCKSAVVSSTSSIPRVSAPILFKMPTKDTELFWWPTYNNTNKTKLLTNDVQGYMKEATRILVTGECRIGSGLCTSVVKSHPRSGNSKCHAIESCCLPIRAKKKTKTKQTTTTPQKKILCLYFHEQQRSYKIFRIKSHRIIGV